MKQTLLVAVASAMIGAATAVFLTDRDRPPARSSPLTASALREALTAALEEALFTRGGIWKRAPGDSPGTGQAEAAGRGTGSGEDTDPPVSRDDPSIDVAPPTRPGRVQRLQNWREDEAVRRAWLLKRDRDVLRWFGTPWHVTVLENGVENWKYKVAPGRNIGLLIHLGRVVGAEQR